MKNKAHGLTAGRLTMMALGTVIGGSFFLGSSVAIQAAGPAIILTYLICAVMVYFILFALSEMTVSNPDSASFRTYASQYINNGTGFVVGWVYWTGMVISMSSEATAVSLLFRTWFPSVSIPFLGTFLIAGVTLLNLLGAKQLSHLESILSAIKIIAIIGFILLGSMIVLGVLPGSRPIGNSILRSEPFLPGGFKSLAGSMLIVLFTYAGFEIIGLAASETENKQKNIPRAIHLTVFWLVTLYILCISVLLLLVPSQSLSENVSPMVTALNRYQMTWAGTAMTVILISAILSTMVAAMFGIGRMLRSLVEDRLGPSFLKDKTDVPYRGILFSGFSMMLFLYIGLLFPEVYLFLISSGGFALLFTYIVLMYTHIRFRKKNGKPEGNCRLCGFPYSSLFTMAGLIIAMFSMPFLKGQTLGFLAGIALVAFFSVCYGIVKVTSKRKMPQPKQYPAGTPEHRRILTEFSEEIYDPDMKKD
ncbi:amino acid permease [Lacrimispora saccharolytica]|uniref:Amino acid permease-associated region n=1 Tax=Lacrimispora saccharolytica (strain ATCC 35040 / DSM 2544 / NRCC 2533 / WM1) TaxID=610130 RepID=D9QZA8_LACSW|nr:amino acid permease [Lacrimispora saccharolytica]ADL04359.1 amino acid permease-associated region [[Clostridium] saccharolyticum WM1]QRV21373.1 amino acid permease [Lacrimispora saccharolytica]